MEVLSYPQFRPSHRLSMDKTIAPHLSLWLAAIFPAGISQLVQIPLQTLPSCWRFKVAKFPLKTELLNHH